MAQTQLTPAQKQALEDFVQSPEFTALPEGRDRANAFNDFFNHLVDGHAETFGDGGFMQAIPGQPAAETATTRTAGAVAGGAMVGPILSGAGGPAGAGAGGAGTSTGTAATVGKILTGAGTVLGSSAGAANKNQQNEEALDVSRSRLAQDQYQANTVTNPGARLSTGFKASMMSNFKPTQAAWGGRGSGQRGETVKFSGGFSNPDIYAGVKPQSDDVVAQMLQEQLLRGSDAPPVPGVRPSSAGDKILGGSALATSVIGPILGGMPPRRNPNPIIDPATSNPTDEFGNPVD